MPRTLILPLLLGPALALAACNREAEDSEGRIPAGSIPENSGMNQGGPGVGDNAPGASDAPAATEAGAMSRPGGAADYPATGKP